MKDSPCPECGQLVLGQRETLDQLMRRYTRQVLAQEGGNKTRAIQVLGITRTTFYRRLNRWKEQDALEAARKARHA